MVILKRKIYSELLRWKKNKNKKPLIIRGQRQVGKTFIVKEFAKNNYKSFIYLDFRKDKELRDIFDGSFDINEIVSRITSSIPFSYLIPNDTLLIFDEVQDCPRARSSLKYFALDKRYDVICTGSLLGIKGYSNKSDLSIPVGYEENITMKPLDFEEFMWANGFSEEVSESLRNNFKNETQVMEVLHKKLTSLFRKYICVGGMPDVVLSFIDDGDMNKVLYLQRNILESYKDDFGTHLNEKNEIEIHNNELVAILDVFNSIPSQLSKENKKFKYSLLNKRQKNYVYKMAIEWLEDSGLISRCYNLNNLELPLEGNKDNDIFKIYVQDSGLFISMLEDGTQKNILNGDLLIYKGAIYENIVADAFSKNNKKLYYYHKDSGLEIDFVLRVNDEPTLIEVKAKGSKSKSLNTILSNYENYKVKNSIKIVDTNIYRDKNILYLPHYLTYLI